MLYPSMFTVVFLLITLLVNSNQTHANTTPFTSYKVNLPFPVKQPALAANLTEHKGKELIFIGADDDERRWLSVFSFNHKAKEFVQIDKIQIPDSVIAFDIGEGQEQTLYFLTKDRLLKYMPESLKNTSTKSIVEALKIKSIFLLDQAPSLKQKDFVKDINSDGKDDVVLPHFEHLNLWLSNSKNDKWTYQAITIPPAVAATNNGVKFSHPPLFFVDMNADKKNDIVEVNQGSINIYVQNESNTFSNTPLNVEISEDINNQEWWEIDEADGQGLDQSKLSYRYLENIKDINGDGAPDLIVNLTKSSSIFKRTNDYEFYFGANNSGVSHYKKSPTTKIDPSKTLSNLKFVDLDGDGVLEVLTSSFDISLSKIIGALLSGGIAQKLLIFSMDETYNFKNKPLIQKKVRLKFSISQGQGGFPLIKVIDINGDNFKDLIFSSDSKKINIVLAKPNDKNPYNSSVIKYKTNVPSDAENILDDDINEDGKRDIVMHYGRLDDEELINTVNILMAN